MPNMRYSRFRDTGSADTTQIAHQNEFLNPLEAGMAAQAESQAETEVLNVPAVLQQNGHVRVTFNDHSGATTFEWTDDGVGTGLIVSVASATTGDFRDDTNTFTPAALSDIGIDVQTGGMHGDVLDIAQVSHSQEDTAALGSREWFEGGRVSAVQGTSYNQGVTLEFSIWDGCDAFNAEADVQTLVRQSMNWHDLSVHVSANNISATSTVTNRINLGAGSMSISIPTVTTGDFTDASNTDALVDGDTIALHHVVGAGGTTYGLQNASSSFDSSDGPITAQRIFLSDGDDRFMPIGGDLFSTTEGDVDEESKSTDTIGGMWLEIGSNSLTTTFTYTFREAGADQLTITQASSTTGEVTSNSTRTIGSATALINTEFDAPAGAGTIDGMGGFSWDFQAPAPAASDEEWAATQGIAPYPSAYLRPVGVVAGSPGGAG